MRRPVSPARPFLAFLLVVIAVQPAASQAPQVEDPVTAADHLAAHLPPIDSLRHQVGVDAQGGASQSIAIAVPPAILQPKLQLTYSSHRVRVAAGMPHGWSLEGIATIERSRREPDVFFVRGPLDGRLERSQLGHLGQPGLVNYGLTTARGGSVAATYDENARTWTLETGAGDTWLLHPLGAASTGDIGTWRATQHHDRSGNSVAYEWHDGRLVRVLFGGTLGPDAAHHLCVELSYRGRPHVLTEGGLGALQRDGDVLERIVVGAWLGERLSEDSKLRRPRGSQLKEEAVYRTGCEPFRAYDLSLEQDGPVTLLEAVDEVGYDALAPWLPPVTTRLERFRFQYAPVKLAADGKRGGEGDVTLPDLGRTTTYCEFVSWEDDCEHLGSATEAELRDMNSDGLLDYVVGGGGGGGGAISVRWQRFDETTGSRTWSDPDPLDFAEPDPQRLEETHLTELQPRGALGGGELEVRTAILLDLDSDGYPDRLTVPREGFDADVTPGASAPSSASDTSIHVRYGGVSEHCACGGRLDLEADPTLSERAIDAICRSDFHPGFEPCGYDEPAPAQALGVTRAVAAGTAFSSIPSSGAKYRLGALELIDVNSDGWIDLASVDPATGAVWIHLHTGQRGGGWAHARTIVPPWTQHRIDDPHQPGSNVAFQYLSAAVTDRSGSATYMAFRDLNGDGLKDFVIAGDAVASFRTQATSAAGWLVYFGNGVGWEPPVVWAAPTGVIEVSERRWYPGGQTHMEARQRLLDVDRDGLVDLVLANGGDPFGPDSQIYFRNLGDGFAYMPELLPGFWNPSANRYGDYALKVANSAIEPMPELDEECAECVDSECDGVDEDDPDAESDCWCNEYTYDDCEAPPENEHDGFMNSIALDTHRFALVVDLDGDGVLDAINLRSDPVQANAPASAGFGRYPRAYRMTQAVEPLRRRVELTYRPANHGSTTGSASQLRGGFDLLDTVTTTDLLTALSGSTRYEYGGGWSYRGLFRGFSRRVVTSAEGVLGTTRRLRTDERYELSRDVEGLVSRREVQTRDGYLPGFSQITGWTTRRVDTTGYDDFGGMDTYRLPTTLDIVHTGEHSSASLDELHRLDWDRDGDLVSHLRAEEGGAGPPSTTTFEYVSNGALKRLARRQIHGAGLQAETRWSYDGASSWTAAPVEGLLTRVVRLGGWTDGGEAPEADVLVTELSRGPRGEVLRVADLSTGHIAKQTWGFGGAVLEAQTDGVNRTDFAIDRRGRVTRVDDVSNGVAATTRYDGLDRVTEEGVVDAQGVHRRLRSYAFGIHPGSQIGVATHRTVTETTYDGAGAVEASTIRSLDANGLLTFARGPAPDGSTVTTATVHDLRGRVVRTYHPAASAAVLGFHGLDVATERYFNGLGELRRTYADVTLGLGYSRVRNLNASDWNGLLSIDEEGYEHLAGYDRRGWLREIRQDGVTTARYDYDAVGRRTSFVDGEGNQRTWSYDLAGRLRLVSGPDIGQREYEYRGALMTRMADSAGLEVEWTHDALGRKIAMIVDDPATAGVSGYGVSGYGWEYDATWVGKVSRTTDPTGDTSHSYDDLGRPEALVRSWADGSPPTSLVTKHDLHGRRVHDTLPSGATVDASFRHGFGQDVVLDGCAGPAVTLTLSYDASARPTGWASSLGAELVKELDRAGRVERATLSNGTREWFESYTWLDNGLLQASGFGTGLVGSPLLTGGSLVLTYDGKKQQLGTTRATAGGWASSEGYLYDAAGSLLELTEPSGVVWTYGYDASGVAGARLQERSSSAGDVELVAHDAAGRVVGVTGTGPTRAMTHDGLGRLRRVAVSGAPEVVIHRDADGAIVQRDFVYADGSSASERTFGPWRHDERTGAVVERIAGVGSVVNGERRYDVRSPIGQVFASFDDAGNVIAARRYRAYGAVWDESGDPLEWDAFHGLDHDVTSGLYFAGPRAFGPADGQWLQPEPRLLQGLDGARVADPLALHPYRYARNTPSAFRDPSGLDPAQDDEPTDQPDASEAEIGGEYGTTATKLAIDALAEGGGPLGVAVWTPISIGHDLAAATKETRKAVNHIVDAEQRRNDLVNGSADPRTDSWQAMPIEGPRQAARGDSDLRFAQSFFEAPNAPSPAPSAQSGTNVYDDTVPEGWEGGAAEAVMSEDSWLMQKILIPINNWLKD